MECCVGALFRYATLQHSNTPLLQSFYSLPLNSCTASTIATPIAGAAVACGVAATCVRGGATAIGEICAGVAISGGRARSRQLPNRPDQHGGHDHPEQGRHIQAPGSTMGPRLAIPRSKRDCHSGTGAHGTSQSLRAAPHIALPRAMAPTFTPARGAMAPSTKPTSRPGRAP